MLLKRFREALDSTGLKVPMTTVNLFTRPVFKEGALTANDPDVRRFALAKALDAIDLGAELGADIFVLWGGREGTEAHAAKPVAEALDRYAEAINAHDRLHHRTRLQDAYRDRAQAQRAAR